MSAVAVPVARPSRTWRIVAPHRDPPGRGDPRTLGGGHGDVLRPAHGAGRPRAGDPRGAGREPDPRGHRPGHRAVRPRRAAHRPVRHVPRQPGDGRPRPVAGAQAQRRRRHRRGHGADAAAHRRRPGCLGAGAAHGPADGPPAPRGLVVRLGLRDPVLVPAALLARRSSCCWSSPSTWAGSRSRRQRPRGPGAAGLTLAIPLAGFLGQATRDEFERALDAAVRRSRPGRAA